MNAQTDRPIAARRRTQEQRRDEAERALLDAATRLFARNGLDATSLADIGVEAGYSRGLVNHHFGSRAALVERLADRAQETFAASVPHRDTPVEALVAVADAYLGRVAGELEQSRAFFVMWGASFAENAPLRAVFVADDGRFRHGVEGVVRSGQADGSVRGDVDPVGFAVAFVALLRGIGAQFVVDPDGVDLEAARHTCRELVHTSLAPSPEKRRKT